jgi:serine/threonine protein phosphatase 1
MNKIYCLGDLHGELDKLNNLLDKLNIQPTDTILCLGDYVDRGPDSYGVIERLLELKKQCNCIFLCGNHDFLFFDDDKYRSDKIPEKRYSMWNQGARETYKSYEKVGKDPSVHYNFYKILEPYHILELNNEKHLFVHGGYNRHKLIEEQKNIDTFWWDRDLIMAAKSYDSMHDKRYKFKNKDSFKFIYVGHTPVQMWGLTTPQLWGNVWAMDTGVGKHVDSELYALEITTQTLIS